MPTGRPRHLAQATNRTTHTQRAQLRLGPLSLHERRSRALVTEPVENMRGIAEILRFGHAPTAQRFQSQEFRPVGSAPRPPDTQDFASPCASRRSQTHLAAPCTGCRWHRAESPRPHEPALLRPATIDLATHRRPCGTPGASARIPIRLATPTRCSSGLAEISVPEISASRWRTLVHPGDCPRSQPTHASDPPPTIHVRRAAIGALADSMCRIR